MLYTTSRGRFHFFKTPFLLLCKFILMVIGLPAQQEDTKKVENTGSFSEILLYNSHNVYDCSISIRGSSMRKMEINLIVYLKFYLNYFYSEHIIHSAWDYFNFNLKFETFDCFSRCHPSM